MQFWYRASRLDACTHTHIKADSSAVGYMIADTGICEGGYFVINGSEKVLIALERMANNFVYAFAKKQPSKYTWVCEVRVWLYSLRFFQVGARGISHAEGLVSQWYINRGLSCCVWPSDKCRLLLDAHGLMTEYVDGFWLCIANGAGQKICCSVKALSRSDQECLRDLLEMWGLQLGSQLWSSLTETMHCHLSQCYVHEGENAHEHGRQ
eukprot:1451523-Amphidinium_carterae.1